MILTQLIQQESIEFRHNPHKLVAEFYPKSRKYLIFFYFFYLLLPVILCAYFFGKHFYWEGYVYVIQPISLLCDIYRVSWATTVNVLNVPLELTLSFALELARKGNQGYHKANQSAKITVKVLLYYFSHGFL